MKEVFEDILGLVALIGTVYALFLLGYGFGW